MNKESRHTRTEDTGDEHRYFAQIPHTITRGRRGRGLSLAARWFYVYLKSTVYGTNGVCSRSTTTMVKESQLGRATIAAAKKELAKAGLITLMHRTGHYHDTDKIRIVDIWPENMEEFKESGCSANEQLDNGCSANEQPVSVSNHSPIEPSCSANEQRCSANEQPGCSANEPNKKKKDLQEEKPKDLTPLTPQGDKKKKRNQRGPKVFTEEALVVLGHLCDVTGHRFTDAQHIQACLTRGQTVPECLLVIDWWRAIWTVRNPEQEGYFDNETLFRPTKFDKYRAAAEGWDKQGRPPYQQRSSAPQQPFVSKGEQREDRIKAINREILEERLNDAHQGRATFSERPRQLRDVTPRPTQQRLQEAVLRRDDPKRLDD